MTDRLAQRLLGGTSKAVLFASAMGAAVGIYGAPAHADYFTIAWASSPLGGALFGFGSVNQATALTAAASMIYFNSSLNKVSAAGFANADLSRGLFASVSGNIGYVPPPVKTSNNLYLSLGIASLGDSLTFLGSFSGQTATIQADIGGSWSTTGSPLNLTSFFALGAFPAGTIAANAGDELNVTGLFDAPLPSPLAFHNQNIAPGVTIPSTESVTFTLNGVNPTIDVAANLALYFGCSDTAVGCSFDGNFGDGVTFSVIAPPGVTVESSSGVFPDTVPAVPEPSSLALLASGLAGLGGLYQRWKSGRRRRKAV